MPYETETKIEKNWQGTIIVIMHIADHVLHILHYNPGLLNMQKFSSVAM